MTNEGMEIISKSMESLGLLYAFGEYRVKDGEEPPATYFVGEYQEIESMYEDGMQETAFIITGTTRESLLVLEEAKKAIKEDIGTTGKVVIADNGTAVAIFYGNSMVIPTGVAGLKRLQINLTIKEMECES